MDQIGWDDFAKVDFRVGEIVEAVKVENSDKLIRMRVDFGELGVRTVFSGILKYYQPAELLLKKTIFVVNVTPKKIMGELSEAMLFGAEDEITMSILLLDRTMKSGAKVF